MTGLNNDDIFEIAMPCPDTLGIVDQVHVLCIVEQALKEMTHWEREAFLWHQAGSSHRAIASLYGVSHTTVTNACQRAYTKITALSQ